MNRNKLLLEKRKQIEDAEQKTMNNNPLPPELVEKMRLEIRNVGDWQVPLYSKQCAKIAVDYADERYAKELYLFMELKQQRDELVEALKEASGYVSYTRKEHFKQLLKNYEDGKE